MLKKRYLEPTIDHKNIEVATKESPGDNNNLSRTQMIENLNIRQNTYNSANRRRKKRLIDPTQLKLDMKRLKKLITSKKASNSPDSESPENESQGEIVPIALAQGHNLGSRQPPKTLKETKNQKMFDLEYSIKKKKSSTFDDNRDLNRALEDTNTPPLVTKNPEIFDLAALDQVLAKVEPGSSAYYLDDEIETELLCRLFSSDFANIAKLLTSNGSQTLPTPKATNQAKRAKKSSRTLKDIHCRDSYTSLQQFRRVMIFMMLNEILEGFKQSLRLKEMPKKSFLADLVEPKFRNEHFFEFQTSSNQRLHLELPGCFLVELSPHYPKKSRKRKNLQKLLKLGESCETQFRILALASKNPSLPKTVRIQLTEAKASTLINCYKKFLKTAKFDTPSQSNTPEGNPYALSPLLSPTKPKNNPETHQITQFSNMIKSGEFRVKIKPLVKISHEKKELTAILNLERSPLVEIILNPRKLFSDSKLSKRVIKSGFKAVFEPLRPFYNESQQYSIQTLVSSSSPINLLHGPPGTGKTHTLKGCVHLYLKILNPEKAPKSGDFGVRSSCIMVCASSNRALDEAMLRIVSQNIKIHKKSKNSKNSKKVKKSPNYLRLGFCDDYSDTRLLKYTLENQTIDHLLKKRQLANPVSSEYQADSIHGSNLQKQKAIISEITRVNSCLQKMSQTYKQDTDHIRLLRERRQALQAELQTLRSNLERQSAELRDTQNRILNNADVVFVTLNSSGNKEYSGLVDRVEVILVDESSQARETECLIPLRFRARKLILFGDSMQLPPTILSNRASGLGFGKSMFERMICNGCEPFFLDVQYRMHPDLSFFPNREFYFGKLKDGVVEASGGDLGVEVGEGGQGGGGEGAGGEDGASRRGWKASGVEKGSGMVVEISDDESVDKLSGVSISSGDEDESQKMKRDYEEIEKTEENRKNEAEEVRRLFGFLGAARNIIIDVKGEEELNPFTRSISNQNEVEILLKIVKMIKKGIRPKSARKTVFGNLGIITPYRAQLQAICEDLDLKYPKIFKRGARVRVETIDGFQGQEKAMIVFSAVRAASQAHESDFFDLKSTDFRKKSGVGFMNDFRRLNVGITRAKHGLIILCDVAHFEAKGSVFWKNLIQFYKKKKWVFRASELERLGSLWFPGINSIKNGLQSSKNPQKSQILEDQNSEEESLEEGEIVIPERNMGPLRSRNDGAGPIDAEEGAESPDLFGFRNVYKNQTQMDLTNFEEIEEITGPSKDPNTNKKGVSDGLKEKNGSKKVQNRLKSILGN